VGITQVSRSLTRIGCIAWESNNNSLTPHCIPLNRKTIRGLEGLVSLVVYKPSVIFNVPIKFAYDWYTDYSPEDSKIIGSKFPRIILDKAKQRVVYAGYKPGEDGKPKLAVRVVTLHPKTYSWHLDYFAEEDAEVGEYKLTRLGQNKTRLDMTLRNKWKHGKGPSKEEFESGSREDWDKYALALESDYRNRQR